MINAADERLSEWARAQVEGMEVSLAVPSAHCESPTAFLYLLDLHHVAPASHQQPAPIRMELRYLVTASADDPADEHRILSALVFAAMRHAEFRVELQAVSAATWTAFGIAPRPAFLLRLPVQAERARNAAPRIRHAVELQVVPRGTLAGTVVGPDGSPLSAIRVELPGAGLAARTDRRGRFRFAAVPASSEPREFRLHAHGLTQSLRTAAGSAAEPLVIHFDPEEV